jgi:hypothetical protein
MVDPVERLATVLEDLRQLPRELQARACRDAVSAMLASVAQAGAMMPAKSYLAMIHLDAMQKRAYARSAGG